MAQSEEAFTKRKTEAFIAWTRAHKASWPLGVFVNEGKIENFTNPDTDTAFLGWCGAWTHLQAKIAELEAEIARLKGVGQ